MDAELKIMLGRLMAEIVELKQMVSSSTKEGYGLSKEELQELKQGNEVIIDNVFEEREGFSLSRKDYCKILEKFDELDKDETRKGSIDGFYNLPSDWQSQWDRVVWRHALTTMKIEKRFSEILENMKKGGNSPIEIKNF